MTIYSQQIAAVLAQVLAFYTTIGIMAAGFGMMLGGPEQAARVARFFFVRPLHALVHQTRSAVVAIMVTIWSTVVNLIARWVAAELKELAADMRWLATRERGWAVPYLRAARRW